MPFLASNVGDLRKPESTTHRTPGIVRELSAIGVLTTTRLLPGGAGLSAVAWSSCDNAPYSGTASTPGGHARDSRNLEMTRLISAAPGRNARTSPSGVSLRARTIAATVAASSSPKPRPGAPR